MDDFWDDEPAGALGVVLTDDRGSLPFLLVHGEALVAAAAWGLGEAGVTLLDDSVPWSGIVEADSPLVLHDSLCPLTPSDFIAACVARSAETGAVVVGVRPVTDTVKHVTDGLVGATVDRADLVTVCSPVVLPAAVVAALPGPPPLDLAELVAMLETTLETTRVAAGGASYDVVRVEAPPTAARVSGPDDVRLLEALHEG